MSHSHFTLLTSLALLAAGCGSSDDQRSTMSGGGDAGDTSTGGNNTGGTTTDAAGTGPSRSGSNNSGDAEFRDIPGKIRFVNFVSDGTTGVDLDLYWGLGISSSEKVGTIAYGEITEYLTPRRYEGTLLEADEARFFVTVAGDVAGNPSSFKAQSTPSFTPATALTFAMAGSDTREGGDLTVTNTYFFEHELPPPPAGMAHVFGWESAFEGIPGGDFVTVGADGLCSPESGDSGLSNLGWSNLIPEGTTGLALFDANTDPPCATGTPPLAKTIEAGHSYVLLGKSETLEFDARTAVMLEVGAAD